MKEAQTTKKHLLVKRYKIIKFLKSEGYDNEEIGTMFNINRSSVMRILRTGEAYKKSVKNMLK